VDRDDARGVSRREEDAEEMTARLMWPPRAASTSRVALAALAALGCASQKDAPASLGAMKSVESTDLAPYFAVSHAILMHQDLPESLPPPAPGDRVFVTVWTRRHEPRRATGVGPTLLDSVERASRELARTIADGDVRIEIDTLTRAAPITLERALRPPLLDVGLHGTVASDARGALGWVLPSDLIVDEAARGQPTVTDALLLGRSWLVSRVAARANVEGAAVPSMSFFEVDTDDRLEAATPGEAPIRLMRGMPRHPQKLTPGALLDAVRAAADHLARAVDEHGVFRYQYDPVRDQPLPGYDLLRHAGAIYALMEAYADLRVPAWREAATRAIAHMRASLTMAADGSYLVRASDAEQKEVGGNGLALVALVEYAEATGDRAGMDTMRSLAQRIVARQYPDGHFRENADAVREEPETHPPGLKKEISYFAGEATLGLVRLYAIDPDPAWLRASRKAADYLVGVRDAHDDLAHQIHDHWLSYALHDLYVLTREPTYAAHAQKIAQAILLGEWKGDAALRGDFVGTFHERGETTPTSTRLEALASTYQLARFMGTSDRELRDASMRLACFMRGQQLDANSAYFARDPERAMGGVRESLFSSTLRIDYAQHALSGWLRLAHLLRDPTWGTASGTASAAPAREDGGRHE
jgi:hypothetical protein